LRRASTSRPSAPAGHETRRCEERSDEAIHAVAAVRSWIASAFAKASADKSRSLSSGRAFARIRWLAMTEGYPSFLSSISTRAEHFVGREQLQIRGPAVKP